MKTFLTNQKGVGIIIAVLIMLIMAVMGVAITSLLANNTSVAVNYLQSQQALFLAESGVQEALLVESQIFNGTETPAQAWNGWSGSKIETKQFTLAGYGDYDVSVNTITLSITAKGYVPSRTAPTAVRVVTVKSWQCSSCSTPLMPWLCSNTCSASGWGESFINNFASS